MLVLAELGAGLVLRQRAVPSVSADKDTVETSLALIDINPAPLRVDADLLWSNQPNARRTQPVNPQPLGHQPTWTVEINSEGFRGLERSGSDDAFRILCVGDSVTFGFGVDQDDTWPAQLARMLHEHHPGRSIEVINAAVPGWSWMQGLRFLELRGLELDPDIVVIGHGSNDQAFTARITDEERLLALGGPFERAMRRLAGRFAETNLSRLFSAPREGAESAPSPGCTEQIARRGSCRRVSVEQIESAIEKLATLVREAGADLLLVNTDFLATPAVKASRAASERLGLAFEDLVAGVAERQRTSEDQRSTSLGLAPAVRQERPVDVPAAGTNRIVLRVLVPEPSRTYRVEAKEAFGRASYRADARDDGREGDEKAGDSVFTAALEIPARALALEYRYLQDGKTEFTPLPPLESTMGARILAHWAPGYAPVDVFADRLFLVERTHPDARGHAVNAELIEKRISALPSFEREQ